MNTKKVTTQEVIFNICALEVICGRVPWTEMNMAMQSKPQDGFFDSEKFWTWACNQY